MKRSTRTWCAMGLVLGAASCISASAWHGVESAIVVDAANGPGAHFTDIPDAVTAAAPGDLLLVRPGEYSPFLLNKAVTILGAPNGASRISRASPLTVTVVGGIPANQVVVIADLDFPSALSVWGAHGTVALDACRIGRLIAVAADDLRVHRATHVDRVGMQRSHVELVSSIVGGGVTSAAAFGEGTLWASQVIGGLRKEHVWPTIELLGQSKLLCATSSVRGRHVYIHLEGANIWLFPETLGTSACAVDEQSTLALIGTSSDVVRGGDSALQASMSYATSYLPLQIGWGGNGIDLVAGQAAHSGVQLLGGTGKQVTDPYWLMLYGITSTDGQPVAGADKDKLVEIVPDNPTLELLDTPIPGSKVRLRVRGPVGAEVVVAYGGPTIVAVPATRPIESLVATADRIRPGNVPITGEMTFDVDIPVDVDVGAHVFLQAQLILPNGSARASNSIVLIAREP